MLKNGRLQTRTELLVSRTKAMLEFFNGVPIRQSSNLSIDDSVSYAFGRDGRRLKQYSVCFVEGLSTFFELNG